MPDSSTTLKEDSTDAGAKGLASGRKNSQRNIASRLVSVGDADWTPLKENHGLPGDGK
ncbi:hypothetical protein SAMN06265222_107141 [Neorhodopirellula lusitana]|uniref:Uncharacterized protein n=1 Tax=Neorhodopirellula lusitana TaxID=445327 RepID=A0ABY1Q6Z9_9BACT|nr:hypothetical protein [Neorhodopirellula lusitana]SMP61653.1 hypothetical protein SAMN06265222_107141 [Neorhodopirellula lusitana]